MPLIEKSSYRYKGLLFNEHLETIVPALIRKVKYPGAKRSRMRIMDGDFLDIDFYEADNDRAVIISHGLEGSSQRSYVMAMARVFYRHGWDVAAWNFRGCGDDINRKPWFYHSGATNDLHQVISIARKRNAYRQILLVGFSLGGNMTLKYLGEKIYKIPEEVIGAVTFSVPLDLSGSSMKISQAANRLYSNRFLRMLKKKTLEKNTNAGDKHLEDQLRAIKTLREFDEHFTAPLHGFKNAAHYYHACSSLRYLSGIEKPVLIVNAKNDPFLSKECLPYELCRQLENVHLEVPDRGGHMGFVGQKKNGYGWMEQRAITFSRQILDTLKSE